MNRSPSRLNWLGCLALLFLCGCTRQWQDGATTHFAFQIWLGLAVVAFGVVAIPIGFYARGGRGGWILLLGGLLSLVLVAPGLFIDHVEVSDDGFKLRTGFWLMPTVHDVKFSEVQSITLTSETTRGRRGRKSTTFYLQCGTTHGMEKVPVGTLMKEAVREIIDRATTKGITLYIDVEDEIAEAVEKDAPPPTPEGIPEMIEILGSSDEKKAEWASRRLIQKGALAVDPLIAALESENPKVRFGAAHSLGEIGAPAAAAKDKLKSMAEKDPDANVRFYAGAASRKLEK
jgi:hypothetical protein